jgi:hypothetical protein
MERARVERARLSLSSIRHTRHVATLGWSGHGCGLGLREIDERQGERFNTPQMKLGVGVVLRAHQCPREWFASAARRRLRRGAFNSGRAPPHPLPPYSQRYTPRGNASHTNQHFTMVDGDDGVRFASRQRRETERGGDDAGAVARDAPNFRRFSRSPSPAFGCAPRAGQTPGTRLFRARAPLLRDQPRA